MGTYAWNLLYSKIFPAKSRARRRRPAAQAAPSQAVHRNLATGPYRSSMYLWYFKEALNNIVKFSFWLDIIYQVKLIANLQVQKKKIKKFLLKKKRKKKKKERKKEIINFWMHKVGMRQIFIHLAIYNMVILNQTVIMYIMFI